MSKEEQRLIAIAQATQRWSLGHPRAVDVLFSMLVALMVGAEIAGDKALSGAHEPDALAVALGVVGSVLLIWRRLAPLNVLGGISIVMIAYWIIGYGSFLAPIGLAAIYAVVVYSESRGRAMLLLALAVVLLLGVAGATVMMGEDGFRYSNAVSMSSSIAATVVIGGIIRNRKRIFVDTQLRAEQAEADRAVEAERAVSRERIRIAREMHDIVAHGMSVIAVQAAAAQAVVDSDPERTRSILETIETTGRESLTELRRMLGVLRSDDDERGSLEPQPKLADLEAIIANCSESGVPASLVISGDEMPLPRGVGLAVFRIVQEALTNVLKHAGNQASVVIELHYGIDVFRVTVTDTGRGIVSSLSELGGGNGLMGMRERVEAYDGELSAGPRQGGGYEVRAVFSLEGQTT